MDFGEANQNHGTGEPTILALAKEIHENAVAHGWWEKPRSMGNLLSLVHSELSEALEAYRNGEQLFYYVGCDLSSHCDSENGVPAFQEGLESPLRKGESCTEGKPDGIAIELVDAVIRILDMFEKHGVGFKVFVEARSMLDRGDIREAAPEIFYDDAFFPDFINVLHDTVSESSLGIRCFSEYRWARGLAVIVVLVDKWMQGHGLQLYELIGIKHEYNKTRPYRHGNKQC